jgi:His-Xaa-Ser system radical SAM maturase HxsC
MLKLGAESLDYRNISDGPSFLLKLTTNPRLPAALRSNLGYLSRHPHADLPDGFRLYVLVGEIRDLNLGTRPAVVLSDEFSYLGDHDIIRVVPRRRSIRTLYRHSARFNSILLTETCNNYCLMCSQPPKSADDSWLLQETLDLIPMIDQDARELCFSGGEPTLLGDGLINLIATAKAWLPRTALHVLSNGRRFADLDFALKYAQIGHPDLMIGIPLYSDLSTHHDYVVQADGAYDETIRGILNLKRAGARIELRVVLHRQTYARLPELADFIVRNLLFVDHVALMGLELTGFTKVNLAELWIDPYDYQRELTKAVETLACYRVNVSIYNHQLCILPESLWGFARQSISDWKNEYLTECTTCDVRSQCGGFFSSGLRRPSHHIAAVRNDIMVSSQ